MVAYATTTEDIRYLLSLGLTVEEVPPGWVGRLTLWSGTGRVRTGVTHRMNAC